MLLPREYLAWPPFCCRPTCKVMPLPCFVKSGQYVSITLVSVIKGQKDTLRQLPRTFLQFGREEFTKNNLTKGIHI